jgi:hypothetical protein
MDSSELDRRRFVQIMRAAPVGQISLPRQVQPPNDLGNRFSVRGQREPSVFGLMSVSFVLREPPEVFVFDQSNLTLR